jgi:hypothetical protein
VGLLKKCFTRKGAACSVAEMNDSRPTSLAAAHGSASPVTDRTWELHNRGKCGLHYIAHKMREIEIEKNTLMEAITATLEENRHLADGDNCTLIRLKRVVTPKTTSSATADAGRELQPRARG